MEAPIICIGRQYGSGGREIGEKLAAALRIPYYDKLLLEKAARDTRISEQFLREEDERPARFGVALSGNPFADTASVAHAFYSGSQAAYDAGRRPFWTSPGRGPASSSGGAPPPSSGGGRTFTPSSFTPTPATACAGSWRGTAWKKKTPSGASGKWTGCGRSTSTFTPTRPGASRKATI